MLVREHLKNIIRMALQCAFESRSLGALESIDGEIVIEKPKQLTHGDLACGLALELASGAKMPPLQIANILAVQISKILKDRENTIAAMSVVAPGFLNFTIGRTLLSSSLLEIHKQGQSFGQCEKKNKKVLIECVFAKVTGEPLMGHGRNAVYGSCLANVLMWGGYDVEQIVALDLFDDNVEEKSGALTKAKSKQQQEGVLKHLGVVFNNWCSEADLPAGGENSANQPEKYAGRDNLAINIFVTHDLARTPGSNVAIKAPGQVFDQLEVILTQTVNLFRDGQAVRMSKRLGSEVTLSEILEEVGADAVRFYLAECNPQHQITFDLELAKKISLENPVFYIRYAHTRCCALLRRMLEPQPDEEKGIVPARISHEQFEFYLLEYRTNSEVFDAAFSTDPEIFVIQKALIMKLETFPVEIRTAADNRQPSRIARFACEVANELQKFYEVSRVISDADDVTRANLGLIIATRQVLSSALAIIGISAPEKM